MRKDDVLVLLLLLLQLATAFSIMLENLKAAFFEAHEEVMRATGWDKLLENLRVAVEQSPSPLIVLQETALTFVASINWREPFFHYLAAFHVVLWTAVLYATWGPVSDERLLLFGFFLGGLALSSSSLNSLALQHRSSLFTEPDLNYFDEDGLFLIIVFATPTMCLLVLQLARLGWRMLTLMVKVKRAQVRQKHRRGSGKGTPVRPANGTCHAAVVTNGGAAKKKN